MLSVLLSGNLLPFVSQDSGDGGCCTTTLTSRMTDVSHKSPCTHQASQPQKFLVLAQVILCLEDCSVHHRLSSDTTILFPWMSRIPPTQCHNQQCALGKDGSLLSLLVTHSAMVWRPVLPSSKCVKRVTVQKFGIKGASRQA